MFVGKWIFVAIVTARGGDDVLHGMGYGGEGVESGGNGGVRLTG